MILVVSVIVLYFLVYIYVHLALRGLGDDFTPITPEPPTPALPVAALNNARLPAEYLMYSKAE